jgi:hypothetical protein
VQGRAILGAAADAGLGYQVDIGALRREHPGVEWTRFASWAGQMFTGGTN